MEYEEKFEKSKKTGKKEFNGEIKTVDIPKPEPKKIEDKFEKEEETEGHDCLKEANSAGYCLVCNKYIMPTLKAKGLR